MRSVREIQGGKWRVEHLEQQETEEHTSVQSFISSAIQPGQLENYIKVLQVQTKCCYYSHTPGTVVTPQDSRQKDTTETLFIECVSLR